MRLNVGFRQRFAQSWAAGWNNLIGRRILYRPIEAESFMPSKDPESIVAFQRRKAVWVALSDLYLDTELSTDCIEFIARREARALYKKNWHFLHREWNLLEHSIRNMASS